MFVSNSMRCVVVSMLCASILIIQGCSAFQSPTQRVTIRAVDPKTEIAVDGRVVGTAPVAVELKRNKSHTIVAQRHNKSGVVSIGTKISRTGVLDIIGTFLLIVPVIGIFTPGFHELDQTEITVPVQ